MVDGKVVALFGRAAPAPEPARVERDLFGSIEELRRRVAFLDEADFHEGSLLRLMAMNSVVALLDVRDRPVFRAPRYQHRRVVTYFHDHGIHYMEFATLHRRASAAMDLRLVISNLVLDRAEQGLTICFYDRNARERGLVASVKNILVTGTTNLVELHPRALAGCSGPDLHTP